MQSVELNQNTVEWLEARKKIIGGSDVPAIMLVSPWRTPLMLFEEKKGICTPSQAEKAYIFWQGHKYETIARQQYELSIGYDVPPVVIKHAQIPWCQVSLDGACLERKKVIEIKYQGEADWHLLKEKGIVPDHYYPQLQYQLLATGFDYLTFIGINKAQKLASTVVYPDLVYIKKMISWCNHFWDLVQSDKPPKHMPMDFKKFTRIEGRKQAKRISEIDQQIISLMDERSDLQDAVLKVARSTRMLSDGNILLRLCDFDNVPLELISELSGLNLNYLGRSINDDLRLLIIKNQTDIKGP